MIIYTLSLDSGGFRVPLKVKVAASSRTPASHRPGVCVHMHTRVCTHTCIHHSKISGGKKGKKGKEDVPTRSARPPKLTWCDVAAQQQSLEASGQLSLLPISQALPTVSKAGELALAGRHQAVAGQGSATQKQTHGGLLGPLRWLG